ncbi:MAG: ankyrin repeat domain-containing protein [Phycisphaeraceae bacterium]|nr:MAG: ankyrin repeat domain-containing protein [Phycisphaeraceae bacterium]
MSESRQPVPSPILGIVGLVVVAGLITLALKYNSPQQSNNPDSPPSATGPADPVPQSPDQPAADPKPISEPPRQADPAPEVPKPLVPSPDYLASMEAPDLASALATVPAVSRAEIATAVLLVAAEREGTPADLIATLASASANLNAQDDKGRTPLMLAAAEANIDMVFALLDHGAAVWTKDAEGMDAREHALARNDARGYEIAEVLEGAGRD